MVASTVFCAVGSEVRGTARSDRSKLEPSGEDHIAIERVVFGNRQIEINVLD